MLETAIVSQQKVIKTHNVELQKKHVWIQEEIETWKTASIDVTSQAGMLNLFW